MNDLPNGAARRMIKARQRLYYRATVEFERYVTTLSDTRAATIQITMEHKVLETISR